MRLKKIPYAYKYLKEHKQVIILDEVLSQQKNFTLTPPCECNHIELEIGCGKGDFIIKKAKMHPEIYFIALEKYDSVLLRAVEKLEQDEGKINNLLFVLGDAKDLSNFFNNQKLQKIYLNFSDPWPKKRHEKRRLSYPQKLFLYQEILEDDGKIAIKTDNAKFFAYTIEKLSQSGWVVEECSVDLYQDKQYAEVRVFQTEYEKKFVKRNMPIYYCLAELKNEKK